MSFDPVTAAFDLGSKLIDHFFPNATEAATAKLELIKLQESGELAELASETQLAMGQLDINKAEAMGTDRFSSRWRPTLGYICSGAFGWNYVVQPMLNWLSAVVGHPVNAPPLDLTLMTPVLLGILGLGTMRSVERIKGSVGPGK